MRLEELSPEAFLSEHYKHPMHEEVDVSKMETTTPTREKSSAVGNAAAMREALEELVGVIDKCDSGNPLWWHIGAKGVKPLKDARAALSAPPRNCDKYTIAESLRKYGFPTKSKPWGEKEWLDFCEWYISEALDADDYARKRFLELQKEVQNEGGTK